MCRLRALHGLIPGAGWTVLPLYDLSGLSGLKVQAKEWKGALGGQTNPRSKQATEQRQRAGR